MRALFLILAVAASPSFAKDAALPLPASDAWTRALQELTIRGLEITASDRESGIIQARGSWEAESPAFACPKAPGAVLKRSYELNLVVRKTSETDSNISVLAKGIEHRYQNKKFIFFPAGKVYKDNACQSTGKLEAELIKSVAGA